MIYSFGRAYRSRAKSTKALIALERDCASRQRRGL